MKRGAGILMPIFSLPNKGIYGTFKEAYKFIDFLYESGQTYWQVLPLNDVDMYGSPFCSTCVNSGNPLFIDISDFVSKKDYLQLEENKDIEFDEYKQNKIKLLSEIYKKIGLDEEANNFISNNEWVVKYGEFMAIKEEYNDLANFPIYLKNKDSNECKEYVIKNKEKVNFYIFCQYLFFKEWQMIKEYANSKGILIIGDSPCNSSMDSKEAWADKEMYLLDENLTPTLVAGVPPDYFSKTGQIWNTLIYNYDVMKKDQYKYLIDKYKYLLGIYDYLKIDHFRGLEYYYTIPYGSEDGKIGKWMPGPGYEFMDLLKENNINNLILEDLGIISEGVIKLKDYSGYPGMKVYQFAFGEENSPFLPHNYLENCIAYTGTHDNDTFYSFLSSKENEDKVKKYLELPDNVSKENVLYESIKRLYESRANVVIINPQDLLMQGNEHRFNTPGTVKNNWSYCSNEEIYSIKNKEFLLEQVNRTKRRG